MSGTFYAWCTYYGFKNRCKENGPLIFKNNIDDVFYLSSYYRINANSCNNYNVNNNNVLDIFVYPNPKSCRPITVLYNEVKG